MFKKSEHTKMRRLSNLKNQIEETQKLNDQLLDDVNKQIINSYTFFSENQLEKYLTPKAREELHDISEKHTYR